MVIESNVGKASQALIHTAGVAQSVEANTGASAGRGTSRLAGVSMSLCLMGSPMTRRVSGFGSPLISPRTSINPRLTVAAFSGPTPGVLQRDSPRVVPLKASDEQGIEGWPAKSPNTNTPAENKKRTKAPIIRVETLEAFKKEVGEEKLRLVAVKFFSPTCRACKAMSESFKALSVKYPNVKFVEVPLTQDNAMLHHGLGVPSFPFGHLYHPEAGLVEEGSINRKQIVGFEQKLKSYLSGSCPLSDDD